MDFTQILDTLFKLCAAMAVGFGLNRAKILNDEANASLSGLIITVTCPALILYSVCKQTEVNLQVLYLLGLGVILYAVLPFAAAGLTALLRPGHGKRGVYRMLLVFGNVTFMGFPVAQALYGEQAIFYMNIFNIPFTLLIFTLGITLLREKGDAPVTALRAKDILSPGFLSGILSLVIYFAQVPVPSVIVNTLGFIGGVTTPLSMVAIGSMIAGFSFREVLGERKLFLLSGLKLLLFPALGFLGARLLFQDPMLAGVVVISLGMPSASLCAMVSRQYGTPLQASTAAMGVFVTTILSVITLPLMLMFLAQHL